MFHYIAVTLHASWYILDIGNAVTMSVSGFPLQVSLLHRYLLVPIKVIFAFVTIDQSLWILKNSKNGFWCLEIISYLWFILADVSEQYICSIFKADDLEVTSKSSALKMEQIECSETSANINQTPGKHPKVSTLDTEHGEILKSRVLHHIKKKACTA
jgi:hypothetical protein